MNMRNIFTLVLILVLILRLNAQEYELGIIGGTNMNFATLKSDYNISGDIDVSPKPSYNIGTTISMKKGKKLGLLSVEYYRLANKENPSFISYNEFGEVNGYFDKSIVIHNLKLSTLFNVKIIGNFFFGCGIAGNLNINSKLKLDDNIESYSGVDYGNKFKATQIRNFTISIPIAIGYEFNKFDVICVFDKGVMNRLNGDDGFIKEINNVLSINFNYRFLKL